MSNEIAELELQKIRMQIALITGKRMGTMTDLQNWYQDIHMGKGITKCECCHPDMLSSIEKNGHKPDCPILLDYNKLYTL